GMVSHNSGTDAWKLLQRLQLALRFGDTVAVDRAVLPVADEPPVGFARAGGVAGQLANRAEVIEAADERDRLIHALEVAIDDLLEPGRGLFRPASAEIGLTKREPDRHVIGRNEIRATRWQRRLRLSQLIDRRREVLLRKRRKTSSEGERAAVACGR